jgi:hypothetical protein
MLRDAANPYIDIVDILIVLGIKPNGITPRYDLSELSKIAKLVFDEIYSGNCYADDIVAKTGIGVVDFNRAITELEMGDYVYRDNAGWTICQ